MQSLNGNFSLPLCISGITRSIPFPNQMEDHDRRRKAVMRRLRSRSLSGSGLRSQVVDGIPAAFSSREIDGGDLSELIRDLCGRIPRPWAAKAA